MKNIEEAAKEAIIKEREERDNRNLIEDYPVVEDFNAGFKAGVEFAQKWIPVEKELPTEQGYYFVKVKNSFPKNCDIIVCEFYEDNETFYSESSDYPIKDATHWRPVNIT